MKQKELNRLKTGDVVTSTLDQGQAIVHKGTHLRIYLFEFIKLNRREGTAIIRSMGKSKVDLAVDLKKFVKNYEIIL